MNKIITKEDDIPESWYISKTVWYQKQETNSKRSTTNSIDKCNLLFIYGNLKSKIEHHIRYIKEENDLQKIGEFQTTCLYLDYDGIFQKEKQCVLNFNRFSKKHSTP